VIGRIERRERPGNVAYALQIVGERAARRTLIEVLTELRLADPPQRSVDEILNVFPRPRTAH
jgi:hypothetical protein